MSEKLHCCERCHLFWTCETKWFRGERGEENLCCPSCNFFDEHVRKIKKPPQAKHAHAASSRKSA